MVNPPPKWGRGYRNAVGEGTSQNGRCNLNHTKNLRTIVSYSSLQQELIVVPERQLTISYRARTRTVLETQFYVFILVMMRIGK